MEFISNKNNFISVKRAYSMLEMFMVMIIVSIIIMSIPVAVKKVNNVTDAKVAHGRFECWIEGGKIKQYYVEKSPFGKISSQEPTNAGKYCTFNPPRNTNYIMISAVGGGGSGAKLSNNPNSRNKVSQTNTYINNMDDDVIYSDWAEWFKVALASICRNSDFKNNCMDINHSEKITAILEAYWVNLRYAYGGRAGKVVKMMFPSVPEDAKIIIKPGAGGTVPNSNLSSDGNNGNDTLVEFVYGASTTTCFDKPLQCNNTCCNIIVAKGGEGGKIKSLSNNEDFPTTSHIIPLGETINSADYGIGKLPFVLGEGANFKYYLDNDKKYSAKDNDSDSKMESRILKLELGDGGKGAYDTAKDTRNNIKFYYQIDGAASKIDITNTLTTDVLKTLNINNFNYNVGNCELSNGEFKCSKGCANCSTQSPATSGNNGGVVIVW